MAEGDEQLSAPSKEQLEQEKQLLLAFKPVMQKFLHDHTELQVSALYALQVHCNANGFPKGTVRPTWDRITDISGIDVSVVADSGYSGQSLLDWNGL